MSGVSEIKLSVFYTRNSDNGARPKSRVSAKKVTASKCYVASSVDECTANGSPGANVEFSFPREYPGRPRSSFGSPKKATSQSQGQNSPKCSPRRRESPFVEDFDQEEMGLPMEFYRRNNENEPQLSFLEFESLYTLEKQISMQRPRQEISALDGSNTFHDVLLNNRGLYTELPESLAQRQDRHRGQEVCSTEQLSQVPAEGFSFAPGWALNADHFYQWQHRGKTTRQVSSDDQGESFLSSLRLFHSIYDTLHVNRLEIIL
ncbi:hypothetical protein KPH14_002161 [Odynerus spinipes]|uniref:Uncharacterized protein n=1 Tax=Odynerus spinipes TaxID=1348599 RepID=A0AAD9RM11_9HYME|nr:hypothetical protein KPH14_002161 [Odynerus spinipes]